MKEDQDVNGKIQSNNRKNRQVNMPMLNVVGAQNVWIGTAARDGSITGAPGQYAAIGSQTDMVRAGAIYGMQRGQRPVSGLRLYGTKGGGRQSVRHGDSEQSSPQGLEGVCLVTPCDLPQRTIRKRLITQDTGQHGWLSAAPCPVQSNKRSLRNRTP